MRVFVKVRIFMALAATFFTTNVCVNGSSDGIPIANFCNNPVIPFSNTSSVLPGTDVTITCSVPTTAVTWTSTLFPADPLILQNGVRNNDTRLGAIVFILTDPTLPCVTTTATIANISESLQGLDLTCTDALNNMATVSIDVIDPPGVVMFDTNQDCGNVVTNWIALSDDPCPITGYNVGTPNSSVLLAADQTNYTYSISDSDCGNTIEINVSAVSAAGTGNITTNSLTISCTHTNVSIVDIISCTSAVIQWTSMDVTGVVGYEVMSMSVAESPTGSTATFVSANVSMASILVDDYTIPVTFTVTSLLTGNEICYTSRTTLPPVKNANQITTNFGAGIVTFPFLNVVMTNSLSVSWSPFNGTCVGDVLGMNVIVNCSGLTNDVKYTVTIEITLIVNGRLLPISCSESFTPTASPLPPSTPSVPVFTTIMSAFVRTSTATATATPTVGISEPEGVPVALIVGIAVGIFVVVLLVIVVILIICIVCVKKKSQKDTDSPVALVERKTKDPQTGEVATYEDPADVQHKPAPTTGDMYAVVDKQPLRRAAPSTPAAEPATYQDPDTIKRQVAPTGDMYALPQSKQPKPVYAEVNKQNEGLQYADLDVIGAGQGGSSRPPNSQEARPVYSEIQHPKPSSPTGQDDSVDIPLEECLYEKH